MDGTTGKTGVRDKPKILLGGDKPGARLAPMTRDFHPGRSLSELHIEAEDTNAVSPIDCRPSLYAANPGIAACGASPVPPFRGKGPFPLPASTVLSGPSLEPRATKLSPPARRRHSVGFGAASTQRHVHRQPAARPAESRGSRPTADPRLDRGVQIGRIWGKEAAALPDPSGRQGSHQDDDGGAA